MSALALDRAGRATALGAADVRVKFAILLSLSLLVFVWNSLAMQLGLLAATVGLALAMGVPAATPLGLVRMMWPAFLLVALIQGLWSPLGVTPVWVIPEGVPWLGGRSFLRWEGLAFGLAVCCRLVTPLLGFAILFATASPNAIVRGLVRIGAPFKAAFLVSTTFRFVPLLLEELGAMRDAQRLRGIDVDAMGMARRLLLTGRLMVPLVVASLRRAQEIEVALQARGFSGRRERTYLDPGREHLGRGEAAAIALLLLAPPLALAARILFGLGGDVL